MAARPDVDRSLDLIRSVTRRMRAQLAALPPEAWEKPSNCPPWRVRELIGHVVNGAWTFRVAVERGVAGSVDPAIPESEREARIAAVAAAPPHELLARLERDTEQFESLFQRLSADELEAICYHRRGNRPARWYVKHRLAEVAFHQWDLERSLGQDATLDPEAAELLLPTLLESNLPRIYPHGPRGEGRFRLAVAGSGDRGGDAGTRGREGAEAERSPGPPLRSWLLDARPERLDVQPDGGPADVTITAPAAVLALLVYGRADLAEEERQGRARVEGDRALAARFRDIFRGP